MGGLSAFATQAFQVLGAVNTVLGAVDQFSGSSGKRDYDLKKQQNAVALQNAQEKSALEKQQIALTAQQAEEERRSALRRAIAKQKAAYGGSGIDSSSGSAQAVLLGKVYETDEDRRNSNALDTLKKASADLPVYSQQRVNTLQLTQLREKNKYNQLTSAYDFAGSVGGILKD